MRLYVPMISFVREAGLTRVVRICLEGTMVGSTSLEDLIRDARKTGWSSGTGSLEEMRSQARRIGLFEVATRRGDSTLSKLKPTATADARPNSLSSRYGVGAQPLHTDGAHLARPPDIVILHSEQPNGTPTLVLRPVGPGVPWEAIWDGMFLVHNWRDSFFAPVREQGLRYDPACMFPCDSRAVEVVRYFDGAVDGATELRWSLPHQLLVIDNKSAVHGRAAVAAGDGDRTLGRIALGAVET